VVLMDVARLAGVSPMTVSRVVNGRDQVSPATRDRVLEAIEGLGYRPNVLARGLATGRSGLVGVVTSHGTEFGPTSRQRGVAEAARAAGFTVVTVYVPSWTSTGFADAMEELLNLGVEGVLVVAGQDAAAEAAVAQRGRVPVVVVQGDERGGSPSPGIDQVSGARRATEHLLSLGHRNVAHLAGPQDWAEARDRTLGWRQALSRAGIEAMRPVAGDWSAASGFEAGRELAAAGRATAVFVGNDQMATGLLRALHESGMRVPHDVAVVGFDDSPESPYLIPPLTTVHQDFAELGRLAVGALLAALKGTAPRLPPLEPELVLRQTTGVVAPQRN
jgi:DNA-binding LacI/PurR family transcriptional regulator